MGLLYELIDRGISDDEIATCYKEMKLLWERVNCLIEGRDVLGVAISVIDESAYKLQVKVAKEISLVEVVYNKSNGVLHVISGTSLNKNELDDLLFCKSIKGQLYNTVNLLSKIKHKQTSIILKKGEGCYAYVYNSTLTMIVPDMLEHKLSKLSIKDVAKVKDYINLSL